MRSHFFGANCILKLIHPIPFVLADGREKSLSEIQRTCFWLDSASLFITFPLMFQEIICFCNWWRKHMIQGCRLVHILQEHLCQRGSYWRPFLIRFRSISLYDIKVLTMIAELRSCFHLIFFFFDVAERILMGCLQIQWISMRFIIVLYYVT